MNYLYLIIGIIVGIVFIGMGKNTRKRKAIPYEVNKKLKNKKSMDEYNEWCNNESNADYTIGYSMLIFALSATFIDNNKIIGNILSIISLILFVIGFIKRVINNKNHLNHFFIK